MKKFAWATLLFAIPLFGENSIISLENDPSTIVEGKVNVITGEPVVFQEDLLIQGAEPIRIERAYLNGIYGKWYWGIFGLLTFLESGNIIVTEKNGASMEYRKKGKVYIGGVKHSRFEPINFSEGFSNTAHGKISSRTNLKNYYILLDEARGNFEVHSADGTVRKYELDRGGHHLASEKLPNGNWILYEYEEVIVDKKKDLFTYNLKSIRTTNPTQTKVYATAEVHLEDPKLKNQHFFILGSDGGSVEYQYQNGKKPHAGPLSAILSADFPTETLSFAKFTHEVSKLDGNYHAPEECRLQSFLYPLGREFRFDYYQNDVEKVAGQIIEMEDYWIGPLNAHIDPRRSHIKSLSSQVGSDAKLVATHSFIYDLKNQKTSVYEIDGTRIDYSWDSSYRISKIETFSKEKNLIHREQYVWGSSKEDMGNLLSKTFFDESGEAICSKRYFYDAKGNIIEERFYGNLSGHGTPLMFGKNGLISSGEFYAQKCCKYSSNEMSLLIEETNDLGLRIVYDYLPDTDLPISELSYDKDKIKLRKFWEYDEDHILIREVADDGSCPDPKQMADVNVRTIRVITPLEAGPFIGMTHSIEEKYFENGAEHLLKKTVLTYGARAQIIQKDIYDAEGKFRYSLTYDYDEKGRLIKEVNALGQTQSYEYDRCGNRIACRDFSKRAVLNISYDHSNRPIATIFQGDDGVSISSKMSYDQKHHLLSEVDTRGHETKHSYDLLGRRVLTEFQNVCTEEIYNNAGTHIRKIDEEGFITETTYNAYGKPLVITYADGAKVSYAYYLNGLLKSHTDAEGISTRYAYDFLGRIVQKIVGNNLVEENYEYSGNLLSVKVDPNGNRTTYSYDGAGRKVSEEFGGEKTDYFYDSLGRICSISRADFTTTFKYDLLDRVIEEREESGKGNVIRKIQYEYDEAGNQVVVIRYIAGEAVYERKKYDCLHRMIETTDPLGAIENVTYEDTFLNGLNGDKQKVLRKTTTDPMGLQTIETHDPQNRVVSIEKRKNRTLFLEEKSYDKRGLVKTQIDTIFSPDGAFRKVDTHWEYDSRGRVVALQEPEGKKTCYEYGARGELKKKIKPDGIVLNYEYDLLCHLTYLFSSDGTVNHRMKYDPSGRLISFDEIKRTLDAKGRVLVELFPRGYTVKSCYDKAGRRIQCSIAEADCSIDYDYSGSQMTQLTRKTNRGAPLYLHRYLDIDLSGNLLAEETIRKERIHYRVDPLSRKTEVSSSILNDQILAFDPVGNIRERRFQGERIDYTYDDLYQLTSEPQRVYSFDSHNNRLQKDGESYEINALHQVVSHLLYDRNGNPIQYGDTKYIYDALDRLIRIEAPTFWQTFTYDALHRCLTQRTPVVTRHFIYDGRNEIGSFNHKLELLDLRILGTTSHAELGASIAIEQSGKVYVPIHDLQGNLAALSPLDVADPVIYRYSAFGEEQVYNPVSPWRYSSKRVDSETGLINFGRRFYLPSLGRWLTPDPLGFTDGMNLYAYVHNNPLTHMDEYGLVTYVHGQGWQNNPWGSPYSYTSSYCGTSVFANPPEKWNTARVDTRLIPSLRSYYRYSPHYYVNGILNSRLDSCIGARALSASLGGLANVIPIYSPSRGLFQDLKSVCKSQDPNYESVASSKLKRELTFESLCMSVLNDPRKLFVTAFSRGAADTFHAVKNLTAEQKNRLIITACGPIMILPRNLGFSVTNLISRGDYCSLFCNRQLKKDEFCYDDTANVRLLQQKDGFFQLIRDHFFLSKTYQEGIKNVTKPKYEDYGSLR